MKALLILFAVPFAASGLKAQDTTASVSSARNTTLYRDPHQARVLGTIIPGAGQVYAGEYWHGFRDGILTIAGIGLGTVVYRTTQEPFCIITPCPKVQQWPHRLLGAAEVGLAAWTWFSDARDAPHAAERANAAHRPKALAVVPFFETGANPSREFSAGLEVSW